MKTTREQLNAAAVAYEFGRHLAILNPLWEHPKGVAARVDKLLSALNFGPRRASACVERFEIALRNGFRDVRKGEDILKTLTRQGAQIGMFRERKRPDHVGPKSDKITPATAIGLTGH